MNELPKNIIDSWKSAQRSIEPNPASPEFLIEKATSMKKKSLKLQWGNLILLSLSLLGITACWQLFFPFQELLSKVGVALMLGSLLARVIGEAYSVISFGARRFTSSAYQKLQQDEKYLALRTRINGVLTYSTLGLYSFGLLLLAPEFSIYIPKLYMWLIYAAYLLMVVIWVAIIRKNVKQETDDLTQVVELRRTLCKEF
ncbi:hypothetical protein SAMN04489724_0257 [Algoriphagus locisalis]|uniref:Uncharacterized protein n=1 Tax=Algoriphagus locisalis TaxID=305507 RepID=A0A1I7E8A1_9BACT|nr:hypothetical protein [Algoriphagus locisalis]SFU20164.1 hypothetical protein SAMN04489724_0257 [Algoriphagus locisalis]